MRKEAETVFKSQGERWMNSLDLVKRDDFDAVREMAANARDENDKLHALVAKLEERISALEGGAKPAKKPAAKASSKTAGKAKS
jgi:BMFP domain-containing protein YqiC